MTLDFHPAVQRDVNEILIHYGDISPTLAERFDTRLEEAYARIRSNPRHFPFLRGGRGFRRARLHDFPHMVVFREMSDAVRILVVRHERRHPDYGLGRK